jgi:hypothetical protein
MTTHGTADERRHDDQARPETYVAPALAELGTLGELTGSLRPNYGGGGGELGPHRLIK